MFDQYLWSQHQRKETTGRGVATAQPQNKLRVERMKKNETEDSWEINRYGELKSEQSIWWKKTKKRLGAFRTNTKIVQLMY